MRVGKLGIAITFLISAVSGLSHDCIAGSSLRYGNFRPYDAQSDIAITSLKMPTFEDAVERLTGQGLAIRTAGAICALDADGSSGTFAFPLDGPAHSVLGDMGISSSSVAEGPMATGIEESSDLWQGFDVAGYNAKYSSELVSSASRWLIYVHGDATSAVFFLESLVFAPGTQPVIVVSCSAGGSFVINFEEGLLYTVDPAGTSAPEGWSSFWACLKQTLGIPSSRSFTDFLNTLCTLPSELKTIVALANSCTDCVTIVGCIDCVSGWAAYLACAANSVAQCYRRDQGLRDNRVLDTDGGVLQGGWWTSYVFVPSGTQVLELRLGWSGTGDLDLHATAPNGSKYGKGEGSPPTYTGSSSNPEIMRFPNAAKGTWRVRVYGSRCSGFKWFHVTATATTSGTQAAAIDRGEVSSIEPLSEYELEPNFPNPFNAGTVITFNLGGDGPVRLEVFDVLGRRVRTLVDEWRAVGSYRATWDGTDAVGRPVASGMYFYRLTAGSYVESKKMILLK